MTMDVEVIERIVRRWHIIIGWAFSIIHSVSHLHEASLNIISVGVNFGVVWDALILEFMLCIPNGCCG